MAMMRPEARRTCFPRSRQGRSLAESVPSGRGGSKRGSRSLASLGMTRDEGLGMTKVDEGLGMTKADQGLGMTKVDAGLG